MTAPAYDFNHNTHDMRQCAAQSAIGGASLSLAAHAMPLTPLNLGAALITALALLAAHGNVRLYSDN